MKMPVLFVGHGSPMNATRDNEFTRALKRLGRSLPKPRAILVISAHWETDGTILTCTARPAKMEDSFSNDPDLTAIRYNPPGAPAQAVALLATIPFSRLDSERGLDHGAWSILVHLFPCADVPVFQMSLDRNRTLREANVLGERIRPLREQGVLIVGSGNICHNMRESNFNPHAAPLPWNMQFDEFVAELIRRSELDSLAYPFKFAPAVAPYALPTNEHYAPFLYSLGASTSEDVIETIYTGYEHAAISLRSYIWRDKSCSRP